MRSEEGVVVDQRHNFRTYTNVFVGKDTVDWLLRNEHAATREAAVELGTLATRSCLSYTI